MRTVKSILVLLVLALILCAGLIYSGVYNVAADEPHFGAAKMLLGVTRNRSIEARLDTITAPGDLGSPERIERGGEFYGKNCAGCHLGPGQQENAIYRGLNPQPPRLTRHGGHHSARKQFWVIKHGIKMTAMPAWGLSHDDRDLWDVTAFVMELPDLSAEEFRAYTTKNDTGS
ncbi:MAG: c-type cytochrome [Marinobacter sp.]